MNRLPPVKAACAGARTSRAIAQNRRFLRASTTVSWSPFSKCTALAGMFHAFQNLLHDRRGSWCTSHRSTGPDPTSMPILTRLLFNHGFQLALMRAIRISSSLPGDSPVGSTAFFTALARKIGWRTPLTKPARSRIPSFVRAPPAMAEPLGTCGSASASAAPVLEITGFGADLHPFPVASAVVALLIADALRPWSWHRDGRAKPA